MSVISKWEMYIPVSYEARLSIIRVLCGVLCFFRKVVGLIGGWIGRGVLCCTFGLLSGRGGWGWLYLAVRRSMGFAKRFARSWGGVVGSVWIVFVFFTFECSREQEAFAV